MSSVLDSQLYVAAGMDSNDQPEFTLEILDLTNPTRFEAINLPVIPDIFKAVMLPQSNGEILFLGRMFDIEDHVGVVRINAKSGKITGRHEI